LIVPKTELDLDILTKICIPNFISICATSAKKMNGNCWWTDRQQQSNMPSLLRRGPGIMTENSLYKTGMQKEEILYESGTGILTMT
jgi:hypothetical protein